MNPYLRLCAWIRSLTLNELYTLVFYIFVWCVFAEAWFVFLTKGIQ